jgi:hypothetical protein
MVDKDGPLFGIIMELPRVHKIAIDVLEIRPTLGESSPNHVFGYGMPALRDPHGDTRHGQVCVVQPQKIRLTR